MKNHIILHTEPSKTIPTLLVFTVISFVLDIFLLISADKHFAQLSSLLKSDYDYSVTMQEPILEDDYYQFSAGIDFALSPESRTSLNAEIIMQSNCSAYTNMVYWNADILSANGVAISKNLAKRYDLKPGDKLYSKHIVNGDVCEYPIEEIIHETTNVRLPNGFSNYDGIIIMGYDERYADNITHNSIVFTKETIEKLSESGALENIVYREDEISFSVQKIIPYAAGFGVVSIIISVVLVAMLTKLVSHYFKRLIILGYKKRNLNHSYFRFVCGLGSLSIFAAFAFSNIVFFYTVFSIAKLLFLLVVPFIEGITLFAVAIATNKRLWRK